MEWIGFIATFLIGLYLVAAPIIGGWAGILLGGGWSREMGVLIIPILFGIGALWMAVVNAPFSISIN